MRWKFPFESAEIEIYPKFSKLVWSDFSNLINFNRMQLCVFFATELSECTKFLYTSVTGGKRQTHEPERSVCFCPSGQDPHRYLCTLSLQKGKHRWSLKIMTASNSVFQLTYEAVRSLFFPVSHRLVHAHDVAMTHSLIGLSENTQRFPLRLLRSPAYIYYWEECLKFGTPSQRSNLRM